MIYFMQPTGGGPVKIGCTDNLAKRHKQLEAHYGRELVLLAIMDGGPEREAEIHARFDHLRLKGERTRSRRPEQFRPAADLMEFIGRPSLSGSDPDAVEAMPVPHLRQLIRTESTILELGKKVAALRGITMAQYVSDILRPVFARDFAKEVKKLTEAGGK